MSIVKYSEALENAFKLHSFGAHPRELYEPIDYILALGGKRMRPLLTLISANLFIEDWQKAVHPAMAVEVFHNFTLMHDDIMDQAPIRRGKPTVHVKWDTNRAILSGDVMLVEAYKLLEEMDNLKVGLRRFNTTAAEVCEGQQLDMLFAEKTEVTKEEYLEMIRLKTSVLVGFAMELGAIVAGQSEEVAQKLYAIGVNIGLGFQQMDDVLDVYADPEKFGKQVGGDILENKKTWLFLRAQEKAANTPLEGEIQKWINSTNNEAKIEGITSVYNTLGIREEGTQLAYSFFEKAVNDLNDLPVKNTEVKAILLQLIDQIKFREK